MFDLLENLKWLFLVSDSNLLVNVRILGDKYWKTTFYTATERCKKPRQQQASAQMSSIISFAFFLSLLYLYTAQPLPLREGTTIGSLLESPVWEALLNTADRVSGQVESTLENWADYLAETVNNGLVAQFVSEPFMAGFQDGDSISRKNSVETPSFPNDLQETAFHAYDAFLDEFNTLREEALDIIGDLPNWLTLENLKKVDLSKLDISQQNLKELVTDVLNVPEEESRRIAVFFNSAAKLIPSHGYKLGTQAARLTSNANGLVKSYLPKLSENFVPSVKSGPPVILSSLQSYPSMLLSSLQSYPTTVASFITSSLGSVLPFLSSFFFF